MQPFTLTRIDTNDTTTYELEIILMMAMGLGAVVEACDGDPLEDDHVIRTVAYLGRYLAPHADDPADVSKFLSGVVKRYAQLGTD